MQDILTCAMGLDVHRDIIVDGFQVTSSTRVPDRKLFCGHCGEMMVGYGGTSKSGRGYRY